MSLLDDIKASLRVSTSALDAEVQMLIDAALENMRRKGVDPELLEVDSSGGIDDPEVRIAVTLYCKANFGYDNAEADRFERCYMDTVCHLMAHENIRSR